MPLNDLPISSGTVTYEGGRNEVIYTGSVSWALNEDSAKAINIQVPTHGDTYLVNIKNGSGTVTLDVEISNITTFITNPEGVPVATVTAIAANSNKGVVVTGWPLCAGGQIKFTKSAATAAAFSAYIEVRRI